MKLDILTKLEKKCLLSSSQLQLQVDVMTPPPAAAASRVIPAIDEAAPCAAAPGAQRTPLLAWDFSHLPPRRLLARRGALPQTSSSLLKHDANQLRKLAKRSVASCCGALSACLQLPAPGPLATCAQRMPSLDFLREPPRRLLARAARCLRLVHNAACSIAGTVLDNKHNPVAGQ